MEGNQAKTVLIFSTEQGIQSARAKKLRGELEALGFRVFAESNPGKLRNTPHLHQIDWAILVVQQVPPMASLWLNYFSELKSRPAFAALSDMKLPTVFLRDFAPDPVLQPNEALSGLLDKITASKKPLAEIDATLVLKEEETQEKLPESNSDWQQNSGVSLSRNEADYEKDLAGSAEPALDKIAFPGFTPPPAPPLKSSLTSESLVTAFDDPAPVSVSVSTPSVPAEGWDLGGSENWEQAPVVEPVAVEIPVGTRMGNAEAAALNIPVDSVMSFASEAESPKAMGSEDIQVLKRYSTIKEREAREKEATAQVLRRQISQLEERLLKSENERRRVVLQLEEVESKNRALKDTRDQDKHHLGKLDMQHQEELRALQLRMDNAQFQATKAEKKLEEFRERVRNDIQRIRVRERELANRLELQKRDAEALLSAKDERLLQQKREIDRLEFEIESLKERFVDETQKAEERAGKLGRALQSLRLATGMLSGMEEEVLPGTSSNDDNEGEAA